MASIDELLESANQAGCDDELSFIIDEHLRIIILHQDQLPECGRRHQLFYGNGKDRGD